VIRAAGESGEADTNVLPVCFSQKPVAKLILFHNRCKEENCSSDATLSRPFSVSTDARAMADSYSAVVMPAADNALLSYTKFGALYFSF
jgi:hypothetical protein